MGIQDFIEASRRDARDQEDREFLRSAFDKIAAKQNRLSDHTKSQSDSTIQIKLTVGELRALRQFGQKYE